MIIIPMAGLSSRFFKAGYTQPKYMLESHGKTLFDHSVESFKYYFKTEKFLFIIRDVYETYDFVLERIKALGIVDYHITILEGETRGQAETVALGLADMEYDGTITIFNIDTFRPDFRFPDVAFKGKGYLEVFKGEGENWSFAKPLNNNSQRVSETAEKRPISDLCSTGLYHFLSVKDYHYCYSKYCDLPTTSWEKGELYIAPLYNILIKAGLEINYNLIARSDVVFCGTPDEFDAFEVDGYNQ